MANVVSGTVSEVFNRDASGVTFTRVFSYVDGAAVTFNPTFTDLSNGRYRYTYVPIVAGSHSWLGSGSDGDDLPINFEVLTANQYDPLAGMSSILSATTVTVSPLVNAALTMGPIVKGDDYLAADNRAITWDLTGVPGLIGSAVTWSAIRDGSVRLSKAMTVVDADTVRLELLDTDTTKLKPGAAYTYTVEAVIAASDVRLVSGRLVVSS